MYILSNNSKVTITNYVVNRYDNSRGLVLSIYTTKDNISLNDFDTFCTDIKDNHYDILVYNDSDELVQTLRGFYHNCSITIGQDMNSLTAEITNESENTYQIGILKDRNSILENDLTNAQLALVEQYNEKISLQESIEILQNKIQNLEDIITGIQNQ